MNDYIDGNVELSEKRIEILLDELVGYYTVTLDTTLNIGTDIVRAVKFEELGATKPYFKRIDRVSYIPARLSHKSKLGRLNRAGEVVFYGCLSNNNNDGINVAFSEVRALEGERVNILKSKLTKELKITYIGIFDYYKRGVEPPYKIHPHFKIAYDYQRKKFDEYLMVTHQICDAFFSDILRRKHHGRLYQVTSLLSSLFLEGNRTDAIVYPSVQAEGSPVIAIKPCAVDDKLEHKGALAIVVNKDYGYAIYNANTTHTGRIIGEKIIWKRNKKKAKR